MLIKSFSVKTIMDSLGGVLEEWGAVAAKRELQNRQFDVDKVISESEKRVVSIAGIRRAGKSSILVFLYKKLAAGNRKVAYANLEDNRLRFPGVLDEVLKAAPDAQWLLLDEITSVDGWENWVHRINEMKSVHLVVTSSLNKLSRFPPKPLRGRISYFEFFPLSFSEFMDFKKISRPKTTQERGAFERSFEEYLVYGGFPEVVLSENKVEILQEYANSIISLDIAAVSGIPMRLVSDFANQLVVTTLFSATKSENVLKSIGHKVSKSTLLELEQLFEAAYLAFFVPVFSHKVKDRSLYPRKAYLGDTGFFYAMTGKNDRGRVYENAVFLQIRRTLGPLERIAYYKSKSGKEVDFVLLGGTSVKMLIQVAFELENVETRKREIDALVEAAEEFGLDGKNGELLVITKNVTAKQVIGGRKITFKKLQDWLLEGIAPVELRMKNNRKI